MNKTNELLGVIDGIIDKSVSSRFEVKISNHASGKEYRIESKEAVLLITINTKWVGYDLSVNKGVLSKDVGVAADTDLYPLWGEHSSHTLDIFREVEACLLSFLNHKIYIGEQGRKLFIAITLQDNKFKITTFVPKNKWWKFDSSTEEVVEGEEALSSRRMRPLQ